MPESVNGQEAVTLEQLKAYSDAVRGGSSGGGGLELLWKGNGSVVTLPEPISS